MTKRKGEVEQRLIDSFKNLAVRIPVEKITIQDISDGAGVIRATFYHHFQDKYQLLESIFQRQVLAPVRELVHNDMLTEAVTLICVQMQKEKEFYEKLARMEGQNSFESILKNGIHKLIMEMIEARSEKRETMFKLLSPDMLARYYAEFLGFITMCWIRDGMNVPPREMAEMFNYIRTHSLYDIVRDMD